MPDIREPRFSYPKSAVMFHRYAWVLVGNPLTCAHSANPDFSYYAYQNAPANGDTFTHNFYLAAGVYALKVHGHTALDRAKIDWYIDGVLVVSGQDWWSGGTVWNAIIVDSVLVSYSGPHVLKGITNGCNVGSTGWGIWLTTISLT